MLLVLTGTANNQRGPRYCEQVFANLGRFRFTLIVGQINGSVTLAIRCRRRDRRVIGRELLAAYPDLKLDRADDSAIAIRKRRYRWLFLWPSRFSLRPHTAFWNESDRTVADPVASLLNGVSSKDDPSSLVEIECRPSSWLRRTWFTRTCNRKGDPEKPKHQLYRCRIRLSVETAQKEKWFANGRLRDLASVFGQFTSGTACSFYQWWFRWPRFYLNDHELATIWHPITEGVKAPTAQTNDSREFEPPMLIGSATEAGSAVLGTTSFRGQRQMLAIKRDDRRRHLAITGKTGQGKSTLLQRMIASDMRNGSGVALIDPHGDLADDVMKVVPKARTNDVVLFDAGDRQFPPAYDPLRCGQGGDSSLTASALVSAFKKQYGDSWGPRLEYILRNAILALLDVPGTSLASLMRMLNDKRYRDQITNQVTDPIVRSFWQDEFAKKNVRWQEEAVAPIQNKVGQFLSSPLLRNIVGEVPGRIDLRQVMDEQKILIVNLSKGRIGEDASALLGAFLVTGIQQAAMARADTARELRTDFYLYVDEFQNLATDSFATILSEARKYKLNLIVANQFIDQLEETTRQAVFGNVGSMLCFNCGIDDAEVLAPQLAGDMTPLDLISLPKFQAYARMLVDGKPSKPFSMRTLPPMGNGDNRQVETIRKVSRRRYSRRI